MPGILTIDGSVGEGGGQMLRSALSLALITGQSFRIINIRAKRPRPGLLRQHLAAVRAAVAVGCASVKGAELGASELEFCPTPGGLAHAPAHHHFAVGSAGSALLVLQTVLPALIAARRSVTLRLEGGTHNPAAPPFPFLEAVFLPTLRRMGACVEARLERPGFYPAGGGVIHVEIEPTPALAPLHWLERGPIRSLHATGFVAGLPRDIAERELAELIAGLSLNPGETSLVEGAPQHGPGNAVWLMAEAEHATEVFMGFGRKGISAAGVARELMDEARPWLAANAPAGIHLADQLLIPLAMAGKGSFLTLRPTQHTLTNAQIVEKFTGLPCRLDNVDAQATLITVG